MQTKLTTPEMEQRLAEYFDYRRYLIVPNLSWGIGIHECDLAIVTDSNYLWEVEIKVSKADLRKDADKRHQHIDYRRRIKRLYFAVPSYLAEDCLELSPERSGVISVHPDKHKVEIVRKPLDDRDAVKLSEAEVAKIARLGALRIWSLQQRLFEARRRIDELRPECEHMFKPRRVTDKLLKSASVKELEAWKEMYVWYHKARRDIQDELKRRQRVADYQI